MIISMGCDAEAPVNASFPITISKSRELLKFDIAHPHPLQRPLLIIGGFMDPGIAVHALRSQYISWTGDHRVISVQLGLKTSFDQCRQDIIQAVDDACPSTDPTATREVDVIGVSMGGLAARYAAATEPRPVCTPNGGSTSPGYLPSALPIVARFWLMKFQSIYIRCRKTCDPIHR